MTIDELKGFCQGKLANYKIPKKIEILEELPRILTGEILNTMLRIK